MIMFKQIYIYIYIYHFVYINYLELFFLGYVHYRKYTDAALEVKNVAWQVKKRKENRLLGEK